MKYILLHIDASIENILEGLEKDYDRIWEDLILANLYENLYVIRANIFKGEVQIPDFLELKDNISILAYKAHRYEYIEESINNLKESLNLYFDKLDKEKEKEKIETNILSNLKEVRQILGSINRDCYNKFLPKFSINTIDKLINKHKSIWKRVNIIELNTIIVTLKNILSLLYKYDYMKECGDLASELILIDNTIELLQNTKLFIH